METCGESAHSIEAFNISEVWLILLTFLVKYALLLAAYC
jgi:hypothetical protein